MNILFNLGELSIQVIPSKDLCFIYKTGLPIWSGGKDELIRLLKEVHR
jgi:hypothetical protein